MNTNHAQPHTKKNGGFTIIETLVAITILMIAIAGPLTIANQALHAALDARDQMIASNLAQETIEEVRNLKDNYANEGSLLTIFQNHIDANFSSGNTYTAEADPFGSYKFSTCTVEGNGDCALYLGSNGYTYSQNDAVPTNFFRSFTLAPVGDPLSATEYLLTVNVSWNTNSAGNQIQVQDLISNVTR